ncbi:MAG TPA: C39 family peptidase [Chloroflexota bacterium]|nr:C39 family peptidase [Chloroflexota bacterium]
MLVFRPLFLLLAGAIALAGCAANTAKPPYGGVPDSAELVPPAPEGDASGPQAAPKPDGREGGDFAPHMPQTESASPQPAPPPASPPPPDGPAARPSKLLIGPLSFISQTLNNCGPASVAEVLGFWGIQKTQGEVQSVLRGDGNPYGMTPAGVPSYMASLGLDVLLGTGGNEDVIKQLLWAGFPVIVNQIVSDGDLDFHYRPIQGYDDERGTFIASDPLIGPMYTIDYAQFDRVWGYTGRRFIVIYPPDKADQLNAALAGKWDSAYAEGGGQAQPWSVPANASGPAPVTTPIVTGNQIAPGQYLGPVTVSFRATDQSGFGVANTVYSVDGQPVQLFRGQFTVEAAGKHTVSFHSVNFTGSREADKSLDFVIGAGTSATVMTVGGNGVAPTTKATVDGERDANGNYKGFTKLTLTASSDGTSPVAKTTFTMDNGPIQTYSQPIAIAPGTHTIAYSSVDQDGDAEVQQLLTIRVQGSPVGSAAPFANPTPTRGGVKPTPTPVTPASDAPAGPPAGGYRICPVSNPFEPHKVGSPVAIQLRLCDAAGANLSSPAVPLTLQSMVGPPNSKARMPGPFRYVASFNGYEADEAPGPADGTYMVYFTAGGDSTVHSIQFRIGDH